MTTKQKILELKNERVNLMKDADDALDKDNMEEYEQKMAKIKEVNAKITAREKQLEEEERYGADPEADDSVPQAGDGQKALTGWQKAVKAFADAARKMFRVKAQGDVMREGEGADGGYTVPEDIVTKVEELRDAKDNLLSLVTVKTVKTNKGSRTFKKRKQHKGFQTVAEMAKIPKNEGPEYTRLEYSIEKRAGFLPVSNELLEDSDANIVGEATQWLADEARVTANNEIMTVIKAHSPTELKTLDDIIKAWIGLGSAFRPTSYICTNDDGLTWLSTLKDANGRYLLNPNPAEPSKLQLAAGPHIIPILTFDNDTMPNDDTKIPFIIGDLKEGIVYWDRRQITLTMSPVATAGDFNAFEQDMTLWKGTMRDDCTERDADAYVYGQLDPAAVGIGG